MTSKAAYALASLLLLLPLGACAKQNGLDNDAAGETAASAQPVKLLIYSYGATFTNTEFKTLIADPVNKKYPHITIERIEPPATATPEELFSSGTVPDLIFSTSTSYYRFIRMGAIEDLRPWIQKYRFDESRLKPFLYDAVRQIADNGAIYGIPFNSNQHILYYNKDIFDKFGVPYPPDRQMTWDETLDLARRLTRTDGGVSYIGIDVQGPLGFARSLALSVIDPKTGKSLLDSPDWVRTFNYSKKNAEIPGFVGKNNTYNYDRDQFMKDRILAMRPAWLANMVGPMEELRQMGIEVNWDIAPIPQFADRLGETREAQVHSLSVSSGSKHKDEAFQAIAHILSDETQRILSRNGRVPAIVKPELEREFGADIPVLKGKKVQNVFVGQPLKTHETNEYENDITKFVTDAYKDMVLNNTDINTAIRKASENIDKEVERLRKNQ
ncbi:ABC transporter substrate-binding protein [Paenibacillus hamazuiensis]|uniref:ABC transporter substrate-binding protein n=1 Tax=Paenibacillus hamazuiensis TaxID=2936508 RepID=UPI00200D752A|nr:extracellular solute-binding protein [Paenibacillus hamazuiensis]